MTKAERVILIQGDADKWFDQAIFIVKPNTPSGTVPKNLVVEAEQIIANYLTKNNRPLPPGLPPTHRAYASTTPMHARATKKRAAKGANLLLNVLMVLACLALAGVFIYGMLL